MRIRALVFGTTGTGKTSLCNVLTGSNARPADNGPLGVTSKAHLYRPFQHGSHSIELIDTVGLHESVHGTIPPEQAMQQLLDLLCKSKDGYNVLIHVTKAGRITEHHDQDHTFFVEKLTQRQVPVILAITGCENDDPMSSWLDRHGSAFARFGYQAKVPTCFASGGALESHYAALRSASRSDLLGAIAAVALPAPYLLYGQSSASTMKSVLFRLWNDAVDVFGLPAKWRSQVNESAWDLMQRIGVPRKVMEMMVAHLPDVMAELGGKLPIPGGSALLRKFTDALLRK
ncbi:GTPase [Ideonella sp. DXS22W]|uniref:GTPase n=1 Tax=Pseudaquabacterium inlustre TaxID=2984192 RepID=A0ABU9CMV1_9BURK